ncbi:MAG: D-tagatose 3-epimerase, partial [Verrucomicrobiales bacterium]|nr:D-tagatose 3-epimerase [Verrucomicrobiales bacterium]
FTIAKYVTDISKPKRAAIRELAKLSNIEIAGIHWVLAQTEGLHLTHPDVEIRRRTTNYLSELVDFCADLGGKVIVVGSPKQRQVLPEVSSDQAWDWATACFREPAMKAEQRAVTICFEPLSPAETNFINTAQEAIRFAEQLHTPHFKIILDVKAMSSEEKSIPEIIRSASPHFAHFHANDKNLKGPGFGEVDFKPIAAALKEVRYTGFVSVEVFNFDEGPEIIARGSLEYLQHAFAFEASASA